MAGLRRRSSIRARRAVRVSLETDIAKSARNDRRHAVRIIGGQWRGRRLPVPHDTTVRPTPDRVRETVFNWLTGSVRGAACLDLYAGTGVLGLEALSRGAREAVLVEHDPALAAALRARIDELDAQARVVQSDASAWLRKPPSARFDIVFIDPPYAAALDPLLAALVPWLAARATIYVERPAGRGDADELGAAVAALPGAKLVKRSRAGGVAFGLLEVAAPAAAWATGEKSGLE